MRLIFAEHKFPFGALTELLQHEYLRTQADHMREDVLLRDFLECLKNVPRVTICDTAEYHENFLMSIGWRRSEMIHGKLK